MVKKRSVETSVGVFVLIGLICVGYLTVKLGKMEWIGDNYYHVEAVFGSISGLKEGGMVEMAGVQIGQVERIRLDKDRFVALVQMRIQNDVPLSEDVIASVKTSGLIGDKYIRIQPGASETLLKDGERILETESAVDMEELIGKYVFGKM